MHAATPLLILYGSATGNAQDAAERVAREARQLSFAPAVLPMDAYDVTKLPTETLAVFVISTSGQGEFPENARSFWRFLLRKSLPPDSLSGLRCAVFGLGDSGYPKYNVAAKKLDRRLEGLGATHLLERGLGDDQARTGHEAVLDAWLPRMWAAARAAAPLPPGAPPPPPLDPGALPSLGTPRFRVTLTQPPSSQLEPAVDAAPGAQLLRGVSVAAGFARVAAAEAAGGRGNSIGGGSGDTGGGTYGAWRPFPAHVLRNERLTAPGHFQDVRHIELSLAGSGMEAYEPGDLLNVWPRPCAATVDTFLARMGLSGREMVEVQPTESQPGVPSPSTGTAREFAEFVLDVGGASPRRRLFQVLAHFTPASAERERERLEYFGSAEGRDDLYRYNQGEGVTLTEALADFPSAVPPLEWLLEAAPLMRARQFSIASSARMHPGEAHLTVAVVSWTTPYKRQRAGLCSSYLAGTSSCPAATSSCSKATEQAAGGSGGGGDGGGGGAAAGGDVVAVWTERGSMRMPTDARVPLILVGPGTGVAPFRSYLEERAAAARSAGDGL
ncbi:hypothetical protein FOA52_016029 [Chlamydomonas sp. UWO 241]|nr:hypothetical protein FOA52_016029 [Chlamydomonas sp. UWO 241]